MGDIFLKLLNMSITAGWLILAVLCIRLLVRKIPKWILCLLWGAVAIRLICPFSIESPFSILPSTELIKSSTVTKEQVQNYIPSIDSRLTIVQNTINPYLTESFAYNESNSVAPLQIVTYIAGIIWFSGMLLFILCAAVSMLRLQKLVEEAVCIRDNLYICDAVRSPFILGILRPRIYLSSALSDTELNYIIAHETAHLKRKDHWWKSLGYILLCIYWFNPLCWTAYASFCKDIELACDEKTVKDMTLCEKKEYSTILLSCTKQKSLVIVCPLAFGEVGIKERIQSVLYYKKPAFWVVLVSAAACLIFAVFFFTTSPKTYLVKVRLPADGTEPFYYSDEEISPKKNTLIIYAGEGMGDGEVVLLPIEVHEENTNNIPTYITPGMPVKMDVEKGAWYKIGVAQMRDPSGEDMEVFLSVENVDVRIASTDEMNRKDASTQQINTDKADTNSASTQQINTNETDTNDANKQYAQEINANETNTKNENADEMNTHASDYQNTDSFNSDNETDFAPGIILHEQPEADKVCIKVQPSMLREQAYYYYIPTGTDQEWLSRQIQALAFEGKPLARQWEGHQENGWQILYNNMEIRSFEGGYLYYTYDDPEGVMECFIEAPKLCDYIQIMLIEKAGYQNYDVSDIKNIVSARLDVNCTFTGREFYSQTITDTEILQKFEKWFRNAKYIPFGTECGNQCSCLELTLANGTVIRLSMAADSCPNFSIDGVAYDYRPVSDWNNTEFYKCFDEIPWGLPEQ